MQGLLNHGYDGNGWWAGLILLFLCGIIRLLRTLRSKRPDGSKVEVRQVIVMVVFFLGFIALATYQILTHPW
jgi:hypothetical protein